MHAEDKTFQCRVCEKPVPVDTGLCPYCGFQHMKHFKFKFFWIILVTFLFFSLLVYGSIASKDGLNVGAQQDIYNFNTPMSHDEQKFITTLTQYKDEVMRGEENNNKNGVYTDVIAMRGQRRHDIYALNIGPKVVNWIGIVGFVQETDSGNIALSINISPDITLKTATSELKDFNTQTIIHKDTPLFRQASILQKGDTVVFDGGFFFSGEDIFNEISNSVRDSIVRPTFLFEFKHIQKQ